MAAMGSIKQELDEAAAIIRMQMARITELEERLAAECTAHQTLKAIYANPAEPTVHRIRAAQAALAHETPKLQPVPPPLELTAEPVVPLAELVEQRRARQNALCPQSVDQRRSDDVLDLVPVASSSGHDGNGDDRS
jgi:hypothetical protein